METKLIGTEAVAEGTVMFRFEKPAGFSFAAGQSIDLTLVNPPETDAEGNTRAFSLACAPGEDHLAIATRMRDTAFKRTLNTMAEGTPLSFEGPFGSFMLHENVKRPAILLAGGIGITPFHSIVKDAAMRKLPHRIVLFYSNRRPEDAAFLSELQALESQNPNYTLVATMTDMKNSSRSWEGEQGYIDKIMLDKHVDLGANPTFYLAGPAAMVAAMRTMLNGAGVSNDDIRTEEFSGYEPKPGKVPVV